ncbi:MAG: NAD(+)/NADH kinase [Verrucomicrobiota bacterium]|nr:NAD(+)/NADH kinase [Verrucomicrobiota bacterium]
MSKPVQRIALVVNHSKPAAQAVGTAFQHLAEALGLSVITSSDYPIAPELLKGADACCIVGGDGTLLGVVAAATTYNVPVVGINLGKLGFMATYLPEDTETLLHDLQNGNYSLSNRSILTCRDAHGVRQLALNDVVIRTHTLRLCTLHVDCGQEHLNDFRGDGLIFATPTGSTAYNLSTGGPIVHPTARVLLVTPICPHTLSNRTVIIDEHTPLSVRLDEFTTGLCVSVDGREWAVHSGNFPLEIALAKEQFQLIQPVNFSHFHLVRTKLQWS